MRQYSWVLVSFCIPAHNEERQLPRTLRAIHESARACGLEYEIVVADDASTDGTAAAAREGGALVVSIDRRQIAAARNAAAGAARGDVLIFVDADTQVSAGAVGEAMAAVRGGAIGGGSPMRFEGRVPVTARLVMPVFNLTMRLARLTGGAFLFCTRPAFDAAGGWDETLFASEEITMAGALKGQGRFEIVRTPVLTSGRKLRTYSALEIVWMMMRLAVRPRSSLRIRERLGLWYDVRRADPDEGRKEGERPVQSERVP